MATYKVQQLAEVWYEAEIEAGSEQEAIQKAYEDSNLDWVCIRETTEFQDSFYILNTEEQDGEWKEYK